MPLWVAKGKIGTLLLASEMPVPIPRNRTVWHLSGEAETHESGHNHVAEYGRLYEGAEGRNSRGTHGHSLH